MANRHAGSAVERANTEPAWVALHGVSASARYGWAGVAQGWMGTRAEWSSDWDTAQQGLDTLLQCAWTSRTQSTRQQTYLLQNTSAWCQVTHSFLLPRCVYVLADSSRATVGTIKYVGSPYCRTEMYAAASHAAVWWVTITMSTGQTDRQTYGGMPDRYITISPARAHAAWSFGAKCSVVLDDYCYKFTVSCQTSAWLGLRASSSAVRRKLQILPRGLSHRGTLCWWLDVNYWALLADSIRCRPVRLVKEKSLYNKYGHPRNTRTEMHAGRVACFRLVNQVEYAPRAVLKLERWDRRTDGVTDARPSDLAYR